MRWESKDERRSARAKKANDVSRRAKRLRQAVIGSKTPLACAPNSNEPAQLSHLYSSRDDALSIFEDKLGHIVAVQSNRLV